MTRRRGKSAPSPAPRRRPGVDPAPMAPAPPRAEEVGAELEPLDLGADEPVARRRPGSNPPPADLPPRIE
jgi:hypothetical protein